MKPLTIIVALISALVLSANAADTANGFHARLFNTTDKGNTGIGVEEPDRANFSGKWKLNEGKSDLGQLAPYATRVLKVEQTDDSISVARTAATFTGEEFTAMETLSFDGKESESNLAGTSKKKASAKWSQDGQTLTITYILLLDFNGQVTEVKGTEALTLSDGGKTLVSQSRSSSSFGDFTTKAVYDLVEDLSFAKTGSDTVFAEFHHAARRS